MENHPAKLWAFRANKEYFLVPAPSLLIAHDAARRYYTKDIGNIYAISKSEYLTNRKRKSSPLSLDVLNSIQG